MEKYSEEVRQWLNSKPNASEIHANEFYDKLNEIFSLEDNERKYLLIAEMAKCEDLLESHKCLRSLFKEYCESKWDVFKQWVSGFPLLAF